MNNFWNGFEKRAYDYAHEAQQEEEYNKDRSGQTPMDPNQAMSTGTNIGGLLGGLGGGYAGFQQGKGKGALIGGLMGVLGGALLGRGLGYMTAMSDKLGIEEAQRIMSMPKQQRTNYLKSLARDGEISERESREWSREWREESRNDRRHNEMMGALR